MTTITLPWPEKALSPNARCHWAEKAAAVRRTRRNTWGIAKAAGVKRTDAAAIRVAYQFCPPSKRAFDLDNALARMKPATDGIADALGVDDSRFEFAVSRGEPARPNGCVVVTISEGAQ